MYRKLKYIVALFIIQANVLLAQNYTLKGRVVNSRGEGIEFANVFISNQQTGASTNQDGSFVINHIKNKKCYLRISVIGFETFYDTLILNHEIKNYEATLKSLNTELGEFVVSGTMKEVSKLDSPVPVEVYTDKFFKANPESSILGSIQQVNGVRPQLNCNICNTGDIHINGLEGPYTMVLIDGMPIVSGLSTVYGLSGIPQSLIERVEIVKGPASSLYGSEAVGGLINIITKTPYNAPVFSSDMFVTSWGEMNLDAGLKLNLSEKVNSLLGINYFNYNIPIDNNNDGFTDLTLQNRVSIFNKWSIKRKENRLFSVAFRYNYEDRWGGEMNWTPQFRGGDSIYGESIYTNRWEVFGVYQLPVKEDVKFYFSGNGHYQNSVYGNIPYHANQYVGFAQSTWNKSIQSHHLLLGLSYRYNYYDDNTVATENSDTNQTTTNKPSVTKLPGLFIQDEWEINKQNKILSGLRYDINSIHGNIFSPRLSYKWNTKNKNSTIRLSTGNGFRVVNIFTEDHAALTGARKVEITSDLKPETSWNGNFNFVQRFYPQNKFFLNLDMSLFYTYFNNRILPDYETDPNKIIYQNLNGYGESKGVTLSLDFSFPNGISIITGATYQDVSTVENGIRNYQLLTEKFSGTWRLSYAIDKWGVTFDYTGKVYSPMELPLLSELDDRDQFSPWFSLQNIQITKSLKNNFEIYGGIKNLLNYTPPSNSIARSFDPFDKDVTFDNNGEVVATTSNPKGLTFDPSYVYTSNQGVRFFIGFRYLFNKKKPNYGLY